MARIYQMLVGACWVVGLLSLLVSVILKLAPAWAQGLDFSPRGGLVFASSLFLCALATREVERMGSSTT